MIIRIRGVDPQALSHELEDAAGDVAVAEDADVRADVVEGGGEHGRDGRGWEAVDEGYYHEGGAVGVAPDLAGGDEGAVGDVGIAAGGVGVAGGVG